VGNEGQPARYAIRVGGALSERLQRAFAGLEPRRDGQDTVLEGPVLDQAALHGLLRRIEGLGLELIAVVRLDDH